MARSRPRADRRRRALRALRHRDGAPRPGRRAPRSSGPPSAAPRDGRGRGGRRDPSCAPRGARRWARGRAGGARRGYPQLQAQDRRRRRFRCIRRHRPPRARGHRRGARVAPRRQRHDAGRPRPTAPRCARFPRARARGGARCAPRSCSSSTRCPVPIAVDESLHGPHPEALLEALLRAKRCSVVVLKPAALGGALRCIALARLARHHGAAVVVSHLFDGPVALAAAAELALALGGSRAAGLALHGGLSAFPAARFPAFAPGCLVPHARPGLGVENREDAP